MRELTEAEISLVSGAMRLDEFDARYVDVLDQRTYCSTVRSYGFWEGTWIWTINQFNRWF